MSLANLSNEILLVLASGKEIFGISPHRPPLCRLPTDRGESFFWVRTGHSRLRLGSDSLLFRMVTHSLCTLSPEACKAPSSLMLQRQKAASVKKVHWAKKPERQRAGKAKSFGTKPASWVECEWWHVGSPTWPKVELHLQLPACKQSRPEKDPRAVLFSA